MPEKLRVRIGLIAAGILFVTAGHYLTPATLFLWHNIFQRLYYLPIVFAAILFGWRGGLLAAVCSALCYIPHIVMIWHDHPEYTTVQYAEIVVCVGLGAVAGGIAVRETELGE